MSSCISGLGDIFLTVITNRPLLPSSCAMPLAMRRSSTFVSLGQLFSNIVYDFMMKATFPNLFGRIASISCLLTTIGGTTTGILTPLCLVSELSGLESGSAGGVEVGLAVVVELGGGD